MTRFAFGLKWGCFGARGPDGTLVAARAASSPSNDARAIEPRPTPHWRKNQRRVMNLARSARRSSIKLSFAFMAFHSFVMVSSRFKIARLTIAQAAALCRFTSGGIFLRSEEH